MILKSYIVEQNIEILKNYRATLIYGQNTGIKDDVKEQIIGSNKNSIIALFLPLAAISAAPLGCITLKTENVLPGCDDEFGHLYSRLNLIFFIFTGF